MRRLRRFGQAATEQVILISIIAIAVVGAANSAFIPMFQAGVEDLSSDVEDILMSGAIGGSGAASPSGGSPGRSNGPGRRNGNGNGNSPRTNRVNDVAQDPRNRNGLPFELGPPSLGDNA